MATKRTLMLAGAALLVTALSLTAIACSSDDDSETSTTTSTTATTSKTTTTSSSSSSSSVIQETKFNAADFSYNAPSSIAGGLVKLTMANTGKEPHQANLLKLNDGVTDAQFQAALQNPDPSAIFSVGRFMGGPNTADPGGSASSTVDLSAGKYALLCFVSGDDDVPHFAKGMVETINVTAPTTQAKAPDAKETYKLADFAVMGADTLPAGKNTLKVQNDGPQNHELTIIRLDGITFDQAKALITSEEEPPAGSGPPPITELGGIGALDKGLTGYTDVDLTPGTYAFLCFIPDINTGKAHAELGMIKQVTVK